MSTWRGKERDAKEVRRLPPWREKDREGSRSD